MWRPRLLGYDARTYFYILLYGAVIVFNMLVFYAAIEFVPLGIAVAVAFAGPLVVAVAGSRKVVDLLWVVLAAAGIVLLSPITDVSINPTGMALALLTAVMWGIYILVTKRVSNLLEGNTLLALSMTVAAVIALPFGGAGAVKVLGDPALMLLGVVVALLSSAIPFWLEFKAMKNLSPRVFGLLVSLEPAAAAVVGFILLHQELSVQKVIGISLVTIAAIATTRSGTIEG
jgi:inner membrane transporter RhtA